jgi:hypothetical protein
LYAHASGSTLAPGAGFQPSGGVTSSGEAAVVIGGTSGVRDSGGVTSSGPELGTVVRMGGVVVPGGVISEPSVGIVPLKRGYCFSLSRLEKVFPKQE